MFITNDLGEQIMREIDASARMQKVSAINLSPPAGLYGQLLQRYVGFDPIEAAIADLPASGVSLITNLNRIRAGTALGSGIIHVSHLGSDVIALIGSGGGAAYLDNLLDVTIASPVSGEVLKYNGSMWINATSPAGATDLDGLTDVTITSPALGQVLKYNGTYWENGTVSGGGAGNPAGTDQQMQYNDNGVFGADTKLVWDKTLKQLRRGLENMSTAGSGLPFPGMVNVNNGNDSSAMVAIAIGSGSPAFSAIKINGTAASPTAVLNTNHIGRFLGRGWSTTTLSTGQRAQIDLDATEDWNDSAQGAEINFYTTATGTTTNSKKMTLHANGDLAVLSGSAAIGGAVYNNVKLGVRGTLTGHYVIYSDMTLTQPLNNQNLHGMLMSPTFDTQTSNTIPSAYGLVLGHSKTGTGTITNGYGLLINDITDGTNNYAISTGAGLVRIGDVTDTISATTGALRVAGGVAVAKSLHVGLTAYIGNWNTGPLPAVSLFIETDTSETDSWGMIINQEVHAAATAITGLKVRNGLQGVSTYTLGTSWGIIIQQPLKSLIGHTITTSYGLYIEAHNNAVTNYAIYTNAGLVYFGDQVAIGITPIAHVGLYNYYSDANSGGTSWGTLSISSITGTTTNARGIYGRVDTANASFTLAEAVAVFAAGPSKGAASTITTNIGVRIADMTVGGTSNFAIYAGAGISFFGDTTDSTNTSTGAINTSGGVGIAKALNVGTIVGIGTAGSAGYALTTNTGTSVMFGVVTDAGTTNAVNAIQVTHRTSGTAGVGFGTAIALLAEDNGANDKALSYWGGSWVDAADGSRKSRFVLDAYDSAATREIMRGEGSGTAGLIGFLGAAAVARQSIGAAAPAGGTGTAAGGYDTAANRNAMITLVNNMRTALINLGLCAT